MRGEMIFVFGSNSTGRHGAGAAKEAITKHGAINGIGVGPQGNSYGIPTKDGRFRTLPVGKVEKYVKEFLQYAAMHPDQQFQVTAIGCGLAGFKHEEIAPLFSDATDNCYFDSAWKRWLPDKHFWGTF